MTMPLVTAKTITYNHAPFIRQCIEGVLMQETNFPIEYIIGEDCSTDGTREIVEEYARRYPDTIRLITSEQNVGARENSRRTTKAARGKYIALCEGDDYWTDPHKLQKQVDFLEAHPECSMCFHEAYDLWPDGRKSEFVRSRQIEVMPFYTLGNIIRRYFIPTASMVFRRLLIEPMPDEFFDAPGGDWFLHVLLAKKGLVAYLDECMSVYRHHRGGVMSAADKPTQHRHRMLTIMTIDRYLRYMCSSILRPMVLDTLAELVKDEIIEAIELGNGISYISHADTSVNCWVEPLELRPHERRHVTRDALVRVVFTLSQRGDARYLRNSWLALLGYCPQIMLRNRGLAKIGLRSLYSRA